MIRNPGRDGNRVQGIEKTAFRGQTIHAVSSPFGLQFFFSYPAGRSKHLLTRLAARRRFTNDQAREPSDPSAGHIGSAEWGGDEDNPAYFWSMSKQKFLPKILAGLWGKRYFIRWTAEDFHPKLIAAVGKKHPTD